MVNFKTETTMTNNIRQALETEDQFIISVVNEILTKKYEKSHNTMLESYAKQIIKRFIIIFPHLSAKLKNNNFKKNNQRALLIEACSTLSVKEIIELIDSYKSSKTTKTIYRAINTLMLGIPDYLVKVILGLAFDLDLTNLTKEQEDIFHRAIPYVTLLSPN